MYFIPLTYRFAAGQAFTEMMAVKGNEELAKSMGNTRKSLGSVVDTMLELQSVRNCVYAAHHKGVVDFVLFLDAAGSV